MGHAWPGQCAQGRIQSHIWADVCRIYALVWDLVNRSRRSNDLAWDGESKRIIAVGNGREK